MPQSPSGYNASSFPTSYKDPAYDQADQAAAQANSIPVQLLSSIRLKGEKSNADQVSSASAVSPYQITPDTRQRILDQTGVDPYASPRAAAYGAAYVLKQNLGRYGGNAAMAAAAYNGGTNQDKWGNGVMAYAKRVTGMSPANPGAQSGDYQLPNLPDIGQSPGAVGNAGGGNQSSANQPYRLPQLPDIGQSPGAVGSSNGPSPLEQVYNAYKNGQMSPEDKAAFEQDVNGGRIVLPTGMDVAAPAAPQSSAPQQQVVPAQVVQAFNSGKMSDDDAAQFQKDVQSGALTLPQGMQLTPPTMPQSVGGQLERQGGLLARDVIQGAGNAVGMAYDPIAATINAAGSLIGHNPSIPTLGSQANALANRLGLPTPVNNTERAVNAGAEGMASAATLGGAGSLASEAPGLIGQIGKVFGADVGKQATALAAGQAAAQHAQDAGLSPTAQTAINLGTTLLTLGGASAAEGLASKASPAVNALAQRLYAAGRGDAQSAAATSVESPMQASGGVQAAETSAAQGAQPITATAAGAQPAAAFEASAEQAQMAGMGARMQENQARAAAAGETGMPQGGYVGAQEAAGGADLAPAGATATQGGTAPSEPGMSGRAANASESAVGVQAEGPETGVESVAPNAATSSTSPEQTTRVSSPYEEALVPDDQDARREIIGLMQRASGQDRAMVPEAVQAARQQLLGRFNIDPQAVSDARDLGMLDNLQPDHLATDLQMIKLSQLLKSDPGNPMAVKEAEGLAQVGQRAIDLFNEMGAAPDISAMSQKVNDFMSGQYGALKTQAADIYNRQIPALVSRSEQMVPKATLDNIYGELDALGGEHSALSTDERRLLDLMAPKDEMVQVGKQTVPGSSVGYPMTNPTYGLVDRMRKELIAAQAGKDSPFRNMAQWRRQQLIQTLSKDQSDFLQGSHPEAYDLWRKANATTVMYKAMESDMKSLFGNAAERSMLPTLKNSIQGLAKGNVEGFNKVVTAIPKPMRNEVLTSALQNMFTKTGASELGPFGWQEFSRFWRAFRSDDKSYSALMANLEPEARTTLSKLINVSNRISTSIAQKIYTGRSRFAKDVVDEMRDIPLTAMEHIRSAVGPAVGHGIGSVAAGAVSHVPFVGPIMASVAHGFGRFAAAMISPNKTPVDQAVADFLLSDEAKGIVENGPQATTEHVRAAANSAAGRRLYGLARAGSSANDPISRERWLRGALTASTSLSASPSN